MVDSIIYYIGRASLFVCTGLVFILCLPVTWIYSAASNLRTELEDLHVESQIYSTNTNTATCMYEAIAFAVLEAQSYHSCASFIQIWYLAK